MAAGSHQDSGIASREWQQAAAIFLAALNLPPDSRRAYIAGLSIDDPVREQVRLLLAGQEDSHGLLRSTNARLDSPGLSPILLPVLIGPYRLLELIGRGGMGAVYRAERADGHFQKQVAIKLIGPDALCRRSVDRFCVERQILATLEHPGVARMLDGGVSADGQHYIVMEYVRGIRVDEYCWGKSLSIRQVLQLFQQVCLAMQFVHDQGIIHRDIKPSNILVTSNGIVKLLDFGIAKLLSDSTIAPPNPTQDPLQEVSHPFTPDYASPEQLGGGPATFASDIYSLGVLLYELLSGERPYRLTGAWVREEIGAIFDKRPAPPSKASRKPLEQDGGISQITSELDAVTLKALCREPELRYRFPQEFALDIQRYLDGWPVIAREYSFLERTLKHLHRRRGVLLTLGVLLLTIASVAWEGHNARLQRHRAEEQFRKSWQSSVSLVDDLDNRLSKLPNSWLAREHLLSQASAQLESLALEPGVSAMWKFDLARTYIKLGGLQDGGLWWGAGDFSAITKSYQRAVRLLREIQNNPQVSSRDVKITLSMVHRFLTDESQFTRNYDEALTNANYAISVLDSLQPEKTTDSDVLVAVAMALVNKGDVEKMLGDTNPIVSWIKAGQIYSTLIQDGARRRDGLYGLLRIQLRLSFYYCYAGDPVQGMAYVKNGLRLNLELKQLNHSAATWLDTAAHERMGACYAHQHRAALAYAEFSRLVTGISRLAEQNPQDAIPRHQLAWAYLREAKALLAMKRSTDAERDYERVMTLADGLPRISQDMLRVPLLAMAYSGLSAVEGERVGSRPSTRHRLECEYASHAQELFDRMQKRHGMDLDEREEMNLVSHQVTSCEQY